MGTWGVKIYQNDIGDDVRRYYKEQLRLGIAESEITNRLITDNSELLEDEDDGPDFWFALADVQWTLGRLENHVKDKALLLIANGSGLKKWKQDTPKMVSARQAVLQELKQRLETPLPPKKKISQYKLYRCQWKLGDVYAYPLDGEYAHEKGLQGRYFLLHKVGETKMHPGHTVPIVRVKMSAGSNLPTSLREFDELNYMQISNQLPLSFLQGYNGGMFINGQESESLCTNDYGEIPVYCMSLCNTSGRAIPKKLIYIGNYTDVKVPSMEFISPRGDIPQFLWKQFEFFMICRYYKFNVR